MTIRTVQVVEKNAVKRQSVPMARQPHQILISASMYVPEMEDQDPQDVAGNVRLECPRELLTVLRFVQMMEARPVLHAKKLVVVYRHVRTALLLPPMKHVV
jgi:hypothetical protein